MDGCPVLETDGCRSNNTDTCLPRLKVSFPMDGTDNDVHFS